MTQTTLMTVSELLPNGAQSLERLSADNWSADTHETTYVFVNVPGSGNMFGGSGSLYLVTLHGCYSADKGKIEIKGYVEYNYNIGRGANGPTASTATLYPVKDGEVSEKFEKQAHLHGLCSADKALAAAVGFDIDFIKNA